MTEVVQKTKGLVFSSAASPIPIFGALTPSPSKEKRAKTKARKEAVHVLQVIQH